MKPTISLVLTVFVATILTLPFGLRTAQADITCAAALGWNAYLAACQDLDQKEWTPPYSKPGFLHWYDDLSNPPYVDDEAELDDLIDQYKQEQQS